MGPTESLESTLGHHFADQVLLKRALTHKSRAFEEGEGGGETDSNNEQLEFLGDAVLGFVVCEALIERFPRHSEGRLSKCRARFVSASHLCEVARRLELGNHLLLGKGEEMSGGRDKKALLANALEAVIAALYLDAGLKVARAFVVTQVIGELDLCGEEPDNLTDNKSALQEFTQARKLPMPRYRTVSTSGPEHAKVFTVEALVGEDTGEQAEGATKKVAGQEAARRLLTRLERTLAE
ncbi:MAG: ribonuclease III [bacterium]|nr:ribonuclease III [bacterium]